MSHPITDKSACQSRISIGADAGELRTGARGRGEDDFTETYRAIFLMCA